MGFNGNNLFQIAVSMFIAVDCLSLLLPDFFSSKI